MLGKGRESSTYGRGPVEESPPSPLTGLPAPPCEQARTYYAAGLSAGVRNDVTDDVMAMRQRWRLAEVRVLHGGDSGAAWGGRGHLPLPVNPVPVPPPPNTLHV